MSDDNIILLMENISKSFPGVKALNNVQFKVKKGTVHALMGENGAGKSTLMKVLNGEFHPESGTIKFKGRAVNIYNTQAALKLGISMIHQELSPIPYMTVAENIFLGREPLGKLGFIDNQKMIKDTKLLLGQLEIDLNPTAFMKDLSVANKQMVEIAKSISYDASLLIMDEPTSAITEREVEQLFKIIRSLKDKGVAVIYITHKMDEVFQIADEITVFRDGKHISTVLTTQTNRDELISMMVGRQLTAIYPKEEAPIGDVVLSVRNFTRKGIVENVNFDLHSGEILGISGLMGSGRTELIESIFGLHKSDAGEVIVKGKKVRFKSPADAIAHGIALLTEDRKLNGIMGVLPVRDNIMIASLYKYDRKGFLDRRRIETICENEKNRLSIKTPSMNQLIKLLSGGNQQKVLISRWLLTNPDILILDEPTRGIDVGAKAEIHKLMCQFAKEGKGIIMISSELPEIMGMSDRILVMHKGRANALIDRKDATQELIMQAATGTI